MRLQHLHPLFLLIGSIFLAHPSFAKIIHVPTDAASVKEAVEMAVSGDEIVIDSYKFLWLPKDGDKGIKIENKDLTIAGSPRISRPQCKSQYVRAINFDETNVPLWETSTLWIIDSHIILKNLDMTSVMAYYLFENFNVVSYVAPIRCLSGLLFIENCKIQTTLEIQSDFQMKDSFFYGNTYRTQSPYNSSSTFTPAITIGPAERINAIIQNSIVDCDDFYFGNKPVTVNGLNSGTIQIIKTKILGGTFYNHVRGSGLANYPAEPGLHIRNCRDTQFHFEDSKIYGCTGQGEDAITEGLQAPNGGDGIRVEDSTITIRGGSLFGGRGGDAFIPLDDQLS